MQTVHTVHIRPDSILLDDLCIFINEDMETSIFVNAYKNLKINYPKFYKMDEMSKAGFLASEYLLKDCDLSKISSYKKGIVLQNISSSLDTDKKYQKSIKEIASPALFVYTLPNIVMGEIAIRNDFKGENTFFVAGNHNMENLNDYISLLFEESLLEVCLTGYIELPDVYLELRISNKTML